MCHTQYDRLSVQQLRFLLVRATYDCGVQVLSLENGQERQTVLDKFSTFFRNIQMPTISPISQTEYTIKQQAITRDKRQKALDEFFSAVFAQVG